MKVLHAVSSLDPRRGGVAVWARHCIEAQRRAGLEVDVVTLDRDGYGGGLAPLVRAWRARADVVHVHGAFTFATAIGRALSLTGVPVVMQAHGMLGAHALAHGRAGAKRLHRALVEDGLVARATLLVASDAERDALAEPAWRARAMVVPLGVPGPVSPVGRAPKRGQLAVVARLHPHKRLELLRDVVDQCRDARVIVAGDGDIPSVPRHPRIERVGFLDDDAREALLDESEALLLPSARESFGLCVAEAWARGCPTVTSSGVALTALASRHHAGLDGGETAMAFASTVARFLALDLADKCALSDGARAAAATLRMERVIPRMIDVYEGALGRAPLARHA